jgi:hypothetical protein
MRIERLSVPPGLGGGGHGGAVRSLEQLDVRVAAVDIVPGEQLLAARWVGRGEAPGGRLLSIPRAIRRSRSPWTRPGRSPGSSPRATVSAWSSP